jgi:ABC-type lipoprotein export system ATPase subunit
VRAAVMLPGQLSGGEQQRVAVCAALAHRPQLLLADEPSGELDRRNGDVVYELIRELVRDQGTTAVIVSHDHGATRIADRTVRIRDGRLSEEWRGGRAMLVVGHGGWVHLPEHLRAGLGITSHVQADQEGDGVVLRPAPGTFVPQEQPPPPPPPAVTAGSEPVAALRQVTKAFGTRSLFDGYDAEFRRGAMTAVIGRSGSGKSTMLAMLAGLERPDAGEVLVLGQPLSRLDRDGLAGLRRSSVAYVGQEPGLVGFLSAEENVTFTLSLRGVTGAAAVDRARESLSRVGLGPRSDQRAARLSAGERQRLAIARALAAGADLLLVDEPTSRLDQANAESVAALLADAAAGRSLAVVCATHDPLLIECAGVEVRLDDEPLAAEASVPGAGAVAD